MLLHFLVYFSDAAVSRAKAGDRRGALRALWGAFRVFPFEHLSISSRRVRLGTQFMMLVLKRSRSISAGSSST
jgi:hypothetical protein